MYLAIRLTERMVNSVTEEKGKPLVNFADVRELDVNFEKGVTRVRYVDTSGEHWGEYAHSDIEKLDWADNPTDLKTI